MRRRVGVGVVTRRLQWLASLGLVAVLGIGAATALAPSASAKARPRHHHRPVAVTATATAPVSTASFTFTASVSGLSKSLGTIAVSGSGAVDLANDAGSLSVTLPASLAKLIPGGSGGSEVVNVVLSGGTIYVEVPSLATLLGSPWISLALPSSATSAIPGVFTTVGGALGDVNEILAFAQAHHATVQSLGSSTVDNTSVTGSRITAHVKRLNIGATLWANTSDQLVQATLNGTFGSARHSASISAVVNFSGYDAPVTITVPPSSQVRAIPLSVVTGALGGLLPSAHLGLVHHKHSAKKG
jgi:hypothetical protein